jgi:hypothetical protein
MNTSCNMYQYDNKLTTQMNTAAITTKKPRKSSARKNKLSTSGNQ